MKPLDLERFEGATPGPWSVETNFYGVWFVYGPDKRDNFGPTPKDLICYGGGDDSLPKINGELVASAPDLINELKALRKWREAVMKAYKYHDWYRGCSSGIPDIVTENAYRKFVEEWNAAETELHDGKF